MHRLYLANSLYDHNYHRFGYTSCIPILINGNQILPCHAGVPYIPNIYKTYKKLSHTFTTADHNILNKEDTAGISKSPLSWFSNSYFHIVNESFFSDISPMMDLFFISSDPENLQSSPAKIRKVSVPFLSKFSEIMNNL